MNANKTANYKGKIKKKHKFQVVSEELYISGEKEKIYTGYHICSVIPTRKKR